METLSAEQKERERSQKKKNHWSHREDNPSGQHQLKETAWNFKKNVAAQFIYKNFFNWLSHL